MTIYLKICLKIPTVAIRENILVHSKRQTDRERVTEEEGSDGANHVTDFPAAIYHFRYWKPALDTKHKLLTCQGREGTSQVKMFPYFHTEDIAILRVNKLDSCQVLYRCLAMVLQLKVEDNLEDQHCS